MRSDQDQQQLAQPSLLCGGGHRIRVDPFNAGHGVLVIAAVRICCLVLLNSAGAGAPVDSITVCMLLRDWSV